MFEISAFFERIGLDPNTKIENNYDFVGKIQYNAIMNIAYENLDILDKKPLKLDENSLFEKIVTNKRGGYCFELNGLLAAFFKKCGFEVREYFARFLRGEEDIPMRRHRVLSVKIGDDKYFCDIGIGQNAPRLPLLIKVGEVQEICGETYKFEKDEDLGLVLYDLYDGNWRKFISFTEEKVYEIDFVQPSVYCELHSDSIFNKAPIVAIKTKDGRKTIDGATYKVFCGNELVSIEENISEDRFLKLLETEFKITYNK